MDNGNWKMGGGNWKVGNERGAIFHSPSSVLHKQRGTALVEMALTLPVLLLALFVTLDLGRAVYAQNVIANAAREGARYGIIEPEDTEEIQSRAKSYAVGLDPDAVTVTVTQDSNTIRVTVTYQFSAVTPLAGNFLGQGGTLTLKGVSTMNIEASEEDEED
jgi:Flp pilus assembly protein TadG